MRVVVVGASGNVGTAVLRALAEEPAVTSIVGVARRVPRADGSSTVGYPHDRAEWVRVDLAGTADHVRGGLDKALAGADAVVHLAWAIQPSHDRAYQKLVNVGGTRAVLDAVVRAGVPHLVVVSSVGAYSPRPADDHLVDESWPARGIATSDYSVDKAAQEQLLDELEERHPELTVTRFRPALMFQAAAGAEVAGIFLGVLASRVVRLVGTSGPGTRPRFPVLPLPAGLRLQAMHADDAARAVRAAVVQRQAGTFNLASDEVLTGRDLADLLSGGRTVELPVAVVRTALALAWRLRLVSVGEGYLDMAMQVPQLDAARAREELDWAPRRTTRQAVLEMVDALLDERDATTPPLSKEK
ncbi:NAD-dependent epimerase/dehydratase family protein [Puerhibacterium puerhi]|uniref:NAD-dependent epimerase/dehydratase family protein n=1 Tax=Puerhibacterium puerhi TaxID=2692623 RepID=UPI0013577C63|nr:NAD-dependent epimerase/dehydratase family protein [Puerhibacterium puerhi]